MVYVEIKRIAYETIPANGTTIARQNGNSVVWSHKDLNTSSVRSTLANGTLHFDNSGSETDRLELDPTGNSIGFDAYEYGNFGYTPPPEDLFGGFPRFTGNMGETYSLNGIRIPREYALDLATSSDLYGGIFGLLERSARRSAQRVKLGSWWRTWTFDTPDENDPAIMHSNTVTTKLSDVYGGYKYNDSWAINLSLFSWQTKDDNILGKPPKVTGASEKLQKRFNESWKELGKLFVNNPKCVELFGGDINKIIETLGDFTQNKDGDYVGTAYQSEATFPGIGASQSGMVVTINSRGLFMATNGMLDYDIVKNNKVETIQVRVSFPSSWSYLPDFENGGKTVALESGQNINIEQIYFDTDAQAGAFLLLHELGHRMGVLPFDTDGVMTDPNVMQKQAENNEKLLDACYSSVGGK